MFLSLTIISFIRSFYGKVESLFKIYSIMEIKGPTLTGETA